MGPVRGTLFLFPYGILAFWFGWCWFKEKSWKLSLTGGVVIGTLGFLISVIALSTLVGDNLLVLITRSSYGLIALLIALFNLPLYPSLFSILLGSILLLLFLYFYFPFLQFYITLSAFQPFNNLCLAMSFNIGCCSITDS